MIPSYNATEGNVHVFKHMLPEDRSRIEARGYSWDLYKKFDQIRASMLAVATSAAPTYFPAKRVPELQGQDFVDGGVWANCPTLPAIAEATGPLGIDLDRIGVLSIGTGFERLRSGWWSRMGGILFWAWKGRAISLLMNAQSAGAIGTARWLLGDRPNRQRLYRVDDERKNDGEKRVPRLSLENVKQIPDLFRRGKEIFASEREGLKSFFHDHL